jgi:hypothetical protein
MEFIESNLGVLDARLAQARANKNPTDGWKNPSLRQGEMRRRG